MNATFHLLRLKHNIIFFIAALAMATAVPAAAQGSRASSPVELARQAERLKPGEWVWAPAIAPKGPLLVVVDLAAQRATIYRNGVRIGISTVSTGKPGHETPTGVFTILQKDAKHRSSTYNNAPMPFQQRLTWDGVALHAGGLPGYPESHGCVHLPYRFAEQLFRATNLGTTVVITEDAGHPVTRQGGQVLAAAAQSTMAQSGPADDFWRPDISPAGPVTLVISRSEQRASVLRNGVEIGRTQVGIPAGGDATHVLTLSQDAQGRPVWIYAAVAGHDEEGGRPIDEATRNQVVVPPDFYRKVMAILKPGATLLVTQAPLAQAAAGARLTVLAGAL